MTDEQLAALKAELTNDPETVGYSSLDDVEAAKAMNKPDRQTDRESITSAMLAGAVDLIEYAALPKVQRDYFDLLVSAGSVDNTQTVRSQLRDLFPQGSNTRKDIRIALKRPGSRAEELGLGRVTPSDIADAKRA